MEKWEEIYKNMIPVGKYQVSVKNGEEAGLLIQLESNEYVVNINFGAVSALRMIDEGVLLAELFDENEISDYEKNSFPNTIYKIQDGEFGRFIKMTSNELYEALNLEHYIIITMNYVTEIISRWEPSIEVVKK